MSESKDGNSTRTIPLDTLGLLVPQLLPCDGALLLDPVKEVTIIASDAVTAVDARRIIEAMKRSTDRLSAEGGVQAGLLAEPIDGFYAWASKPLNSAANETVLLVCLNRAQHPFPSTSLTKLATLTPVSFTPPRPSHKPVSGISALTRALDTRISAKEISSLSPLALLRIDLGRIGPINDSDGWPASDALIDRAYELLHGLVPPQCFTVHLGGGSFAVIVPISQDIAQVEQLANDIVARLQEKEEFPKGGFPFEPYIGWACYPFDAPDTDTLIGFANAALASIRGQRAGRHVNRVAPEIAHAHADQIGMESDLRQAIIDGAFTLKWLPVLETGTEHVVAFEALVRWNRPGHGEVDPSVFLSCAENAGLIEDIDSWVLHTACRQAHNWKKPLGLSVNVSPSWLATERVATTIGAALEDSGLDPLRLQIELSERCSFGASDIARKELARIRAMGVRLTLDDFGTGFGALERLTNYPFDQVKLDRMFIRRVGVDSRVETVLRSTLHMIHSLNMTCCAEGVETEEQLGFLDAHGCEEIQGYLIGQPTVSLPESRID